MAVDGKLVFVGFGLGVEEGVEGRNTNVFVGLVVNTSVAVAEEIAVCAGEDVTSSVGMRVSVMIDMPGVRKISIQPGCVRMAGSTGSMNPLGRRVRKSLFGSR